MSLSQAAIKKRAEVSMRNASPELKEAVKEAEGGQVRGGTDMAGQLILQSPFMSGENDNIFQGAQGTDLQG